MNQQKANKEWAEEIHMILCPVGALITDKLNRAQRKDIERIFTSVKTSEKCPLCKNTGIIDFLKWKKAGGSLLCKCPAGKV